MSSRLTKWFLGKNSLMWALLLTRMSCLNGYENVSVLSWVFELKQLNVVFSSQHKALSLGWADVLLEKARVRLLIVVVDWCSLSIFCIQNIFLCHISFQYVYSNTFESYGDYDCTNRTKIVSHFMSRVMMFL